MEEREITITLNLKKIQTVLDGLNELPHKVSRDLFDDIKRQATEQLFPKPKIDEKANDNASST
jgi:hypothetical protein